MQLVFLSTLSLRRATALGLPGWLRVLISIHALLAESDLRVGGTTTWQYIFLSTLSLRRATSLGAVTSPEVINFYPRSPCGERPALKTIKALFDTFLSTLSLRRATRRSSETARRSLYFYPRSPCGERPTRAKKSVC